MKLMQRMKSVLALLSVGVILIGILLISSVLIHRKEMDELFDGWVQSDNYYHVSIVDNAGRKIYDGTFSDDDDVRLSTFHLVGDKDGSIPESLLTKTVPDMGKHSVFSGYSVSDTEIKLTIDLPLQTAAYRLLTDEGLNGAVVVADFRSGEIKAMVSTQAVDPLEKSYIPSEAFLNKALMTYTPGSVFKTVTVAAALEKVSQAKSFSFRCSGVNGHIVCYGRTAHGKVSLNDALQKSCNCCISELAETYLSGADLDSFAKKCGILSDAVIVDLPVRAGKINAEADLMWSANGQGEDMCSPVGVAAYYGALANNGCLQPFKIIADSTTDKPKRIMSSYTSRFIVNALEPLCEDAGIYCRAFGKTGTAELDNDVSHAWFACALCDDDQPSYVIVTFVEHGGFSTIAKELTVKLVNTYIVKEETQNAQ